MSFEWQVCGGILFFSKPFKAVMHLPGFIWVSKKDRQLAVLAKVQLSLETEHVLNVLHAHS